MKYIIVIEPMAVDFNCDDPTHELRGIYTLDGYKKRLREQVEVLITNYHKAISDQQYRFFKIRQNIYILEPNGEVSGYNDIGDYTIRFEIRYDPHNKVLIQQINNETFKFYVTGCSMTNEKYTSFEENMTIDEFLSVLEKRISIA